MIPQAMSSKMDNYVVEIHGVEVKVSVYDYATLIDEKVSELLSSLQTTGKSLIMGLDIKTTTTQSGYAQMLLLCAEGHCLIIPKLQNAFDYNQYYSPIPPKLSSLLANPAICFVGMELMKNRSYLHDKLRACMKNEGVDLGHFSARILKKPDLEKAKLADLAALVGMDVIKPLSFRPDWNARVFSEEGIKHVIHDVYTSYLIAKKLFAKL